MASFTDDPAQLLAAYQAANANNPYADPFLFQTNDGSGYWTNALPTNLPYLSDNTPGSLQLTPEQIGFRDVEGNSMQAVQQGMSQAGMSTWDRLKQAIFPGRGMTRQQVELDSLAPEDKAKLESMWQAGQLTESKPWEAPNSYILRALGEEGAAKYGITPQSVKYDNIDSAQAHEWRIDNDLHDNAALNKQALISIGSILAGGLMFGGEAAGAGAGAGEAGTAASGAGYTGTAAELAADGLGGVDMWGSFGVGDAAAGAAGTAYYDSGAGMWVDSATGEGLASGTSVPSGYTAAEGSTALAAGDAAPALANEPSFLDTLKDYYKKGNNAKSLAEALSAFTNSPQIPVSSGMGSGSPSPVSGGSSGGVSGTQNQSVMLENPIAQMETPQAQQPQQYGPLGMIDVTPATNTFLQAGSTWNQNMANALRNRNAY